MKQLTTLFVIMLCAIGATAQTNIKDGIAAFVGNTDVHTTRSFSEDRTPSTSDIRVTSKCDIYTFSLKPKRRQLLTTLLSRFEADRDSPTCYSIISHTGGHGVQRNERQLLIGDNPNNYISIGKTQMENYMLMCFSDPEETVMQHRYAYVVAWYEEDNEIYGRIIVTYSRMPDHVLQQSISITTPDSLRYYGSVRYQGDFFMPFTNTADFIGAFGAIKTDYLSGTNTIGNALAVYKMIATQFNWESMSNLNEAVRPLFKLSNAEIRFLRNGIQDMIDRTDEHSDIGKTCLGYLSLALELLE